MATLPQLNRTSLREQVYTVLRDYLDGGNIQPGETIKLDAIAAQLQVSRTPLRDALLRLETEGFVTIRPRSGVVVRTLTETDIRNLYQMIGALEASVLLTEGHTLTPANIQAMDQANTQMQKALAADDFDAFYAANLKLHGAYTDLSSNVELSRHLKIMKQRLYDFPRKRDFIKEWEVASTSEHELIVAALKAGQLREAARLVQEVHWSFDVQEKFIRRYYLAELESE